MIAKRAYARECVGSCLVGRPQNKWIYSVSDCLKESDLNVGQARRMVYDRNQWRVFVTGNA